MRNKPARLFIYPFFVLFLFSACIYDTDQSYESKVNTVQEPTIEIISLSLTGDTFYLQGSKDIAFNYKCTTHKILAVELVVDNIQTSVVPTFRGRITVNSWDFNRGSHKMTLNVYVKTGSGCLADQLDVEYFVFSQSWVMIIN